MTDTTTTTAPASEPSPMERAYVAAYSDGQPNLTELAKAAKASGDYSGLTAVGLDIPNAAPQAERPKVEAKPEPVVKPEASEAMPKYESFDMPAALPPGVVFDKASADRFDAYARGSGIGKEEANRMISAYLAHLQKGQ